MLKKVGLVAAAAVAAALALSPVAFAYEDEDDHGFGYSGHTEQHPESYCDEDILSGKLQIPEDDDSENNSDDDTDCEQTLIPELGD